MKSFFVAAGLAGCGAHVAAERAPVVPRASPCPVTPAPSASVSVPAAVPSRVAPSAQGDAPKRERAVVGKFDCFSTLEEKRTESLRAWASGGPDGGERLAFADAFLAGFSGGE